MGWILAHWWHPVASKAKVALVMLYQVMHLASNPHIAIAIEMARKGGAFFFVYFLSCTIIAKRPCYGWLKIKPRYTTVELAAEAQQMSRIQEKKYRSRSCRAGAWYFHCYDSCVEVVFWIFLAHTLFNAPTHNNKPQLGPQHVITMTKCGKMEFRCTGLMRSIAYRWNRLVNRKTGYRCQDDSSHRNKIEINVFIVRMIKFFRKRA
jgi:hypothetical protein